jgi:hypothetical protein
MPEALELCASGAWLTAAVAMASDAPARNSRKNVAIVLDFDGWPAAKLSPIGVGACPEKASQSFTAQDLLA